MTRAESYAEGWHAGRRWAEEDIRDGRGLTSEWLVRMREEATEAVEGRVLSNDESTAFLLGRVRGYRDTVARFESGALTFAQFDSGPPR